MSDYLWLHGAQHTRPACPSPTPGACSNWCPLGGWCHLAISSSVFPFSWLQSLPALGFFQMSQFFTSVGQSIGASASVLPINIQGWFPLGLTGLTSWLTKGLSRVFSSTLVWSINSLALSLIYGTTFTSMHEYWKNHSFDYMDLCWQSNVSAF